MLLDNNQRNPSNIQPSEITPREIFEDRRQFIKTAGLGIVAGALAASQMGKAMAAEKSAGKPVATSKRLNFKKTSYGSDEKLTKYEDVTTYNNYYEFGTGKSDPAEHATLFKPRPWTISIEGEVKKLKLFLLMTCLNWHHWKNASIECVAWKGGPW